MRCDEIKERFVELLYNEHGTPPSSRELQEHVRSCPACRQELEELRQTQGVLKLWKDESPLRPVAIPRPEGLVSRRLHISWRYLRYAAVAAMVVITFLALANAQITWNKEGFSFSAHLFPRRGTQQDFYTKAETRDLLKRVLDDSESRMNETNYLMMQRMLDTIEQDRWMEFRLIRDQAAHNRSKN